MTLPSLLPGCCFAALLAGALGSGPALAARAVPALLPPAAEVPCAGSPKRHDSGQVEQCTLARDYRSGDLTLPAGSLVTFTRTGVISEVFLAAPVVVSGQTLPPKATLFFDAAGRMRHFWLREESLIQGYRLRAMGKGYTGYLGHMLHANGKLRAAWLAGEEVIDGIPCASKLRLLRGGWHAIRLGARAMAWFYEDGRLRQAMLARDTIIQGQAFRKGEVLSLRRDGTLDPTAQKLDWNGWGTFRDD